MGEAGQREDKKQRLRHEVSCPPPSLKHNFAPVERSLRGKKGQTHPRYETEAAPVSEQMLRRRLRLDPDNPDLLDQLACRLRDTGNGETDLFQAAEFFRRSTRLRPDYLPTLRTFAAFLVQKIGTESAKVEARETLHRIHGIERRNKVPVRARTSMDIPSGGDTGRPAESPKRPHNGQGFYRVPYAIPDRRPGLARAIYT